MENLDETIVKSICVICQQFLWNGDETNAQLCGHVFHRNCIRYSLFKKPQCPICKKESRRRDLITLYVGNRENRNKSSAASGSSTSSTNVVTEGEFVAAVEEVIPVAGDLSAAEEKPIRRTRRTQP